MPANDFDQRVHTKPVLSWGAVGGWPELSIDRLDEGPLVTVSFRATVSDTELEAARFYAATFPGSEVTAVHETPSGPLLERDRGQWRQGEPVRLVYGPLGPLLADHPRALIEALEAGGGEAKRAFEAMMRMKKLDIATIEAPRRG